MSTHAFYVGIFCLWKVFPSLYFKQIEWWIALFSLSFYYSLSLSFYFSLSLSFFLTEEEIEKKRERVTEKARWLNYQEWKILMKRKQKRILFKSLSFIFSLSLSLTFYFRCNKFLSSIFIRLKMNESWWKRERNIERREIG